jgi:hypothetical protein
MDDRTGIMKVLQYALAREIPIEIDAALVPNSGLAAAFKYLSVRDTSTLKALRALCMQSASTDVRMTAIEVDPAHYFQSILGLQKLTKENLVLFSAAVSTPSTGLAANPSLLQQSLARCLELANSKKLYPYLLALAAVVLSVMKAIPGQLASYLFNFMAARRDDLPIAQAARCLLLLSSESETGKFTDFTCSILSSWPTITPEAGLLYMAISKTNRRRLFDEVIPRIASEFLEQQQPSLFCVGLRLVSRGLTVLPNKGIQSLLTHCLTRLIKLQAHRSWRFSRRRATRRHLPMF